MKKEKIIKKINLHYAEKNYCRIIRKRNGFKETSTGFILNISEDFILIQESDEFRILGYQIFPTNTINKVRCNKNDKTIGHILKEEGLLSEMGLKYKIDITNWVSIFEDIMQTGLTIISECEEPKKRYFCIGQITVVGNKSISVRHFNAQGILDKKDTKHKYKDITKVSFDDHYANTFAKYVREV